MRGDMIREYKFFGSRSTYDQLAEQTAGIRGRHGGPVVVAINAGRFARMVFDQSILLGSLDEPCYVSMSGGGVSTVIGDPNCPIDSIYLVKP